MKNGAAAVSTTKQANTNLKIKNCSGDGGGGGRRERVQHRAGGTKDNRQQRREQARRDGVGSEDSMAGHARGLEASPERRA